MRMQNEAGADEFAIFSDDLYAKWKRHDPDFDEVFEGLAQALIVFFHDPSIRQKLRKVLSV